MSCIRRGQIPFPLWDPYPCPGCVMCLSVRLVLISRTNALLQQLSFSLANVRSPLPLQHTLGCLMSYHSTRLSLTCCRVQLPLHSTTHSSPAWAVSSLVQLVLNHRSVIATRCADIVLVFRGQIPPSCTAHTTPARGTSCTGWCEQRQAICCACRMAGLMWQIACSTAFQTLGTVSPATPQM